MQVTLVRDMAVRAVALTYVILRVLEGWSPPGGGHPACAGAPWAGPAQPPCTYAAQPLQAPVAGALLRTLKRAIGYG